MLAIGLGKLLKEQEEQIKSRDESLEKAREEIKWLRGMLKEPEAIEPIKQIEQTEWTVCGNCRNHIISKWTFCPYCGKAVRWK